jgi:hypothetical protein
MSKSGSEVASRINGIPRGSAKTEPDSPEGCCDKVWAQARCWTRRSNRLGENRAHDENQDERSYDLADQVCAKSADSRRGAEAGKFQRLIGSLLPMRQEVKPDENGSREGACHLRNEIRRKLCKLTGRYSEAHSHGGIEMRIAAPASDYREVRVRCSVSQACESRRDDGG